jgi:hypothetical protein
MADFLSLFLAEQAYEEGRREKGEEGRRGEKEGGGGRRREKEGEGGRKREEEITAGRFFLLIFG